MGDSESRKNARAEAAAAANLLRERPQTKLGDLPRFEISTAATSQDLRACIAHRRQRYVQIASCLVEGMPVTPPERIRETHHIVVLTDPEAANGDQGEDVVAVELLFRETDNYFTAFRPLTRAHRREDPSGWYFFSDVCLPEFLKKNQLHRPNFHKLSITSGYGDQGEVSVGAGSLHIMFRCYAKFKPENAMNAGRDREVATMSTMIFFGEGQRLPDVLNHLAAQIDLNVLAWLPTNLVRQTNMWSGISIGAFQASRGKPDVLKATLQMLESRIPLFVVHMGEEYSLRFLVGPEAKIMLLKYDSTETRELIKYRQRLARR